MTHTFKAGDKGKTYCGLDYEVLAVNAKGDNPIVANIFIDELWTVRTFSVHGRYFSDHESRLDLIPPKATRTFWVPLLRDDGVVFDGCAKATREEALQNTYTVIAIKEFTITEGEGMDE